MMVRGLVERQGAVGLVGKREAIANLLARSLAIAKRLAAPTSS
jgi:hypothetical protein